MARIFSICRRVTVAGRWVGFAFGLSLLAFSVIGCAGRAERNITSFHDTGAGSVAVMPVVDYSGNELAARLLREKIIEAVHFRGYRRIPSLVIDEFLAPINKASFGGEVVSFRKKGEIIGVDALLNVSLREASFRESPLSVTTTVRVTMELVAPESGSSLWRADERETSTSIAVTQRKRQQAAHMVFESLMDALLARAFSTFPVGPLLAPEKK